jgi:hypothetical protein
MTRTETLIMFIFGALVTCLLITMHEATFEKPRPDPRESCRNAGGYVLETHFSVGANTLPVGSWTCVPHAGRFLKAPP